MISSLKGKPCRYMPIAVPSAATALRKSRTSLAEPELVCPVCQGVLERPLTAPRLHFKGGGFYVNDYPGKSSSARLRAPHQRDQDPLRRKLRSGLPAVAAASSASTAEFVEELGSENSLLFQSIRASTYPSATGRRRRIMVSLKPQGSPMTPNATPTPSQSSHAVLRSRSFWPPSSSLPRACWPALSPSTPSLPPSFAGPASASFFPSPRAAAHCWCGPSSPCWPERNWAWTRPRSPRKATSSPTSFCGSFA